MATKTSVVTVGTTPVRLDVAPDYDDPPGQQCTYNNVGTVDVWLGDSAVTAGNGIRLAPGGVATETLPRSVRRNERWAVVASGTCQVNVDQVGV